MAAGFEPANNGFANRPLRPLGYATLRASSLQAAVFPAKFCTIGVRYFPSPIGAPVAKNAISEAFAVLIVDGASSWTVHQHRIRRVGRRGYPQRKALAQIAKRLERRAFQDLASMVTPIINMESER